MRADKTERVFGSILSGESKLLNLFTAEFSHLYEKEKPYKEQKNYFDGGCFEYVHIDKS